MLEQPRPGEKCITFFVRGEPQAQPRARGVRRGDHVHMYNPDTAKAWKQAVEVEALRAGATIGLECPVKVDLTFYFPRRQRMLTKKAPDGLVPYTKKPDKDNLEKAVLDALTDAGVWLDDKQVYSGRTEKFFVPKAGGQCGCLVVISW